MASNACIDGSKGDFGDAIRRSSIIDTNSIATTEVVFLSVSAIDAAARESEFDSVPKLCDFDCNILHKNFLEDRYKLADAASEVVNMVVEL